MAKEYGMEFDFEFEDHCDFQNHSNTTIVTVKRLENSVKVGGVSLGGGLSKIYMIDDVETDIRLSADDDIAALAEQYKQTSETIGEVMLMMEAKNRVKMKPLFSI